MMYIMQLVLGFLFVFVMTAIVDWMWGKYIIHTSERSAFKSAMYSSLLTAMGAYITISFVSDHRMLVPAIFGAFFGTYLTVKMSK
jgi:hypothetical protein